MEVTPTRDRIAREHENGTVDAQGLRPSIKRRCPSSFTLGLTVVRRSG